MLECKYHTELKFAMQDFARDHDPMSCGTQSCIRLLLGLRPVLCVRKSPEKSVEFRQSKYSIARFARQFSSDFFDRLEEPRRICSKFFCATRREGTATPQTTSQSHKGETPSLILQAKRMSAVGTRRTGNLKLLIHTYTLAYYHLHNS